MLRQWARRLSVGPSSASAAEFGAVIDPFRQQPLSVWGSASSWLSSTLAVGKLRQIEPSWTVPNFKAHAAELYTQVGHALAASEEQTLARITTPSCFQIMRQSLRSRPRTERHHWEAVHVAASIKQVRIGHMESDRERHYAQVTCEVHDPRRAAAPPRRAATAPLARSDLGRARLLDLRRQRRGDRRGGNARGAVRAERPVGLRALCLAPGRGRAMADEGATQGGRRVAAAPQTAQRGRRTCGGGRCQVGPLWRQEWLDSVRPRRGEWGWAGGPGRHEAAHAHKIAGRSDVIFFVSFPEQRAAVRSRDSRTEAVPAFAHVALSLRRHDTSTSSSESRDRITL